MCLGIPGQVVEITDAEKRLGVVSVGGGATEMGDSFFRCAMRRGRMCALLIVDGAGSTFPALSVGVQLLAVKSIARRAAAHPSMALNSTGGSPNRACMTTTSSVYLLSDPPIPAP